MFFFSKLFQILFYSCALLFPSLSGLHSIGHNLQMSRHIVDIRRLIAGFEDVGGGHYCAGSILSSRSVLTAAHCVHSGSLSEMRVVTGAPNRLEETPATQFLEVDSIIRSLDDLAILHLSDEIVEDGEYVQRIELADVEPEPNINCTVFGWGRLFCGGPRPSEVVYENATVWAYGQCPLFPGAATALLCAANTEEGDYHGDAGSPLVCDGKLFGVSSFRALCRDPGEPKYYIDVYAYRSWIIHNKAIKAGKHFALLFTVCAFAFQIVNILCPDELYIF